jgi:hypothetical protein
MASATWVRSAGTCKEAENSHDEDILGILSTDITITANPTDPSGVTRYDWTVTYPNDLPSGSTPLSDPAPPPGSMVYSLTAVFTFNGVLSDVAAFVDMGPYMIN